MNEKIKRIKNIRLYIMLISIFIMLMINCTISYAQSFGETQGYWYYAYKNTSSSYYYDASVEMIGRARSNRR